MSFGTGAPVAGMGQIQRNANRESRTGILIAKMGAGRWFRVRRLIGRIAAKTEPARTEEHRFGGRVIGFTDGANHPVTTPVTENGGLPSARQPQSKPAVPSLLGVGIVNAKV